MEKVVINASTSYEILLAKGLLDVSGELISRVIKPTAKACVVTDDNVDKYYGERLMKSLSSRRRSCRRYGRLCGGNVYARDRVCTDTDNRSFTS